MARIHGLDSLPRAEEKLATPCDPAVDAVVRRAHEQREASQGSAAFKDRFFGTVRRTRRALVFFFFWLVEGGGA